jgi:hypothetical protein
MDTSIIKREPQDRSHRKGKKRIRCARVRRRKRRSKDDLERVCTQEVQLGGRF